MARIDQVTVRGDAPKLREFADALNTRRVRDGVRAFVIPADRAAYVDAIDNGAIAALHNAGFTICDPETPDPAVARSETAKQWPGEDTAGLIDEISG